MNAPHSKHLVAAAVLTVVGGLGLIVAGWWVVGFEYQGEWSRLTDTSWWTGGVLRALGFLAFGKAGFKIALACVVAAVAVVAKLRLRRRTRAEASETDSAVD